MKTIVMRHPANRTEVNAKQYSTIMKKKRIEPMIDAVAYHEAGHAVCAYRAGIPIDLATIVPKQDYAGCVAYACPSDDPRRSDEAEVRAAFAGSIAERLYVGRQPHPVHGSFDRKIAAAIIERLVKDMKLAPLREPPYPAGLSRPRLHHVLADALDEFEELQARNPWRGQIETPEELEALERLEELRMLDELDLLEPDPFEKFTPAQMRTYRRWWWQCQRARAEHERAPRSAERRLWRRLRREARGAVERDWRAIDAVARELLLLKTLSGREIAAIIQKSDKSFAVNRQTGSSGLGFVG